MQFTMNFNDPTRSLRIANSASLVAKPVVAWYNGTNGSPFSSAAIQTQFLTPSLDVPLPAKSIVRWMEFPRFISPLSAASLVEGTVGKVATISSQTITLPSIPDLLLIYVKPQTYPDSTLGDFSLPVAKISLQFDNFSGLLSNHSAYELYKMSVNNGLEMTWDEWSGSAWANGSKTALVGGPLVLRPGRDFALSSGQASGLVGNFTLQFDLTVDNTVAKWGVSDGDYAGKGVSIYTVTANSGFFETIRGSSRILKGVVNEQDILSAPMAEVKESSERMVGQGKAKTAYKSGGALGRMSNYRKH
jgi:hypothetical protein